MNVAGGVRLGESSIDAALAAALYSARTDLAIDNNTTLFGELSLAGEIRPVGKAKQRVKTAQNFGLNCVICNENEAGCTKVCDIKSLIKTTFSN